jgi:hypothetical protein
VIGVIQVAEPAPFCGELNSGLITELGNPDKNCREADQLVVVLKSLNGEALTNTFEKK